MLRLFQTEFLIVSAFAIRVRVLSLRCPFVIFLELNNLG